MTRRLRAVVGGGLLFGAVVVVASASASAPADAGLPPVPAVPSERLGVPGVGALPASAPARASVSLGRGEIATAGPAERTAEADGAAGADNPPVRKPVERQELARLLERSHRSGDTAREVQALRDLGEALAAAGQPREALELYHRERVLSDALMQANRRLALADLQARNDAQARQRDIELLARENALQTAALANRGLLQAIWALLAAVALLACGIVLGRYRQGRRTHGRLTAHHAALRTQSERDPLTDLANRRHFGAVMARQSAGPAGLRGALLLVDVDHFKAVNDQHGHAGGDQALVEIAQRLIASVRAGDLVVRWGGEEFLVLAPHATAEQAAQMAARILTGVGATPVVAAGRALPLTVSIGHAAFPLPPGRAPVRWESAVALTDQALLAAKQRGRNRAVGVEATTLDGTEPLPASPAGFAAAWQGGRLDLRETAGPPLRRGELESV